MNSHPVVLMSAGLVSIGVLTLSACTGVSVGPGGTTTSSGGSTTASTSSTAATSSSPASTTASSTPPASTTASSPPSTTATTSPGTGTAPATVRVFFSTDASVQTDCSAVTSYPRRVATGGDVLTTAMKELLRGPTRQEAAAGARSFFSAATADALLSARTTNGVAYINLRDLRRTIPNASTSCGSASFLASMTQTAKAASGARAVTYAFQRQPRVFWEWLQMGCPDDLGCEAAPFGP